MPSIEDRYDRLVRFFGQAEIDSVLCPCWNKNQVLHDRRGFSYFPYEDFVDNMNWFEDMLRRKMHANVNDRS